MQMNAGIILAGDKPDFVNVLRQSNAAAQEANQTRQQNALRQLYQEQGEGIAQGEPNALNALAQFDPQAALGVRQSMAGERRADAQLGMQERGLDMREQEFGMRVKEYASGISAQQAAAEAEKIKQGVFAASAATSPEQWDQVVTQFGRPELAGQFDNKEPLLRQFMTAAQILEANQGGPSTEAEREISRVMETGVDRKTAIKIKEGVYKVITDPVTRESIIIDLSNNGQQIGTIPNPGQPAPAAAPQQNEQPPQQAPLTFGDRFEGADSSFGVEGALRRGINFAADTLGRDQVYPDVASAQSDFAVMREDLTNKIASAYDGRVPAFLLEGIQKLTPQAGSVFEGPGQAQSKLRALGRSLQQELGNVTRSQRRRLSPADSEALAKRQQVLETSIDQIADALDGFKSGGSGQTKSGIKWSVE